MSAYSEIKNAIELLDVIRVNGLSDDMDDLDCIQSIFDSTTTEELIRFLEQVDYLQRKLDMRRKKR